MSPVQFRLELTRSRDRKASFLAIVLCTFIGCVAGIKAPLGAPSMPMRKAPVEFVLLIDADFSTAETASLIGGFDDWAEALGPKNLRLRFGVVTHATAWGASAPPGWLYVIRSSLSQDIAERCGASGKAGCWRGKWGHIYIAADIPSAKLGLASVAAHELGHAMGFDHCPSPEWPACTLPNVMAETTDHIVPPNAAAIREFCLLNGCAPGTLP